MVLAGREIMYFCFSFYEGVGSSPARCQNIFSFVDGEFICVTKWEIPVTVALENMYINLVEY